MVQTIVRSNRFPDPVISVWEHRGVRSIGSDLSSIWVWTKTWELIVSAGKFIFINKKRFISLIYSIDVVNVNSFLSYNLHPSTFTEGYFTHW